MGKVLALWIAIGSALPAVPRWPAPRSISVMGASSVLAYVKAGARLWQRAHPGYQVVVSGGGSVAGLIELGRGHVNVAMSDIAPRAEWAAGVVGFPLGKLPILFVVNRRAGVDAVGANVLADILRGRIGNWAQVGGQAMPVVVVGRPLASGARLAVERQVLGGRGSFSRFALMQLSNGAVLRTVADTPGAIGFVEGERQLPGVVQLAVGGRSFDRREPNAWPYYAIPTLYVNPGASPAVLDFVRYLARRPDRARYGLVPLPRGQAS